MIETEEAGLIILALDMASFKWQEDANHCYGIARDREGSSGFRRLAEQFEKQVEEAQKLIDKLGELE